jgi:molybdopterin-guanine dinucleotide biosynthesis protein A
MLDMVAGIGLGGQSARGRTGFAPERRSRTPEWRRGRQTVRMSTTLGVILTGGAARRMGGSKLDRRLPDGRRLVDAVAETVGAVAAEVIAVGEPPPAAGGPRGGPDAPGGPTPAATGLDTVIGRLPIVPDARPGEGPLAGLEVALRAATDRGSARLLLVPCDMPWLTAADLRGLAEHPAPLVHPSTGGLPLAADVDDELAAAVASALDAGRRRLMDLLSARAAAILAVPDEAVAAARYANVNRPEDLRPGR